MKHVVIHHAHHPDEGVYRLVFAASVDFTEDVAIDNPQFDPDADPNAEDFDPVALQPRIMVQRTRTVLVDPQEIVWAADDPRWDGKHPETVAEEQRQIVSDELTRRAREREQAELDGAAPPRELGEIGREL